VDSKRGGARRDADFDFLLRGTFLIEVRFRFLSRPCKNGLFSSTDRQLSAPHAKIHPRQAASRLSHLLRGRCRFRRSRRTMTILSCRGTISMSRRHMSARLRLQCPKTMHLSGRPLIPVVGGALLKILTDYRRQLASTGRRRYRIQNVIQT
jgi:hypothetical protein